MDFFKELELLQLKMPRLGLLQINSENSTYTFATDQVKNCYLLANAVQNEDCMYGRDFYENKDCVDCDHIFRCTLCHECLNCKNCYNSEQLQDCEDCRDCSYGYDLRSCRNCFGCAGLRKKEFYIFNKPYSKEEYFEELKKILASSKEVERKFQEVKEKTPRLFAYNTHSEQAVGDYCYRSKKAFYSFDIADCQDVGYVTESKKLTDSYDIFVLEDATMCYEISSSHILNNCNFCFMCMGSSDLEYCEFVVDSKNCFGCFFLKNKQYYILNQPYQKEDYFKKLAEIKAELRVQNLYGRLFLPSTYPLQDTVARWSKM